MREMKVGLALGSGAFRGLAHIGVLDVLEHEGIPIDMIAGTSIGALIGAVYLSGMSPEAMEKRVGELNETHYYDLVMPRKGFLAGKRLQSLVRELTDGKTIEEASKPFAAVACDFETMQVTVLREGPMDEAVRASVSIPGVFVPMEMEDGRLLVDGGIVDRVPADICRDMGADIVIGVDVGYRGQTIRTNTIIEHMLHAYDILEWQVAQQRVSDADLMITPDVVDTDPARLGNRGALCVERGRVAARLALPEIRALLESAKNVNIC